MKATKLTDKSEYGSATMNEYLSDMLASNSEDEKQKYSSETTAKWKKSSKSPLLLFAVLIAATTARAQVLEGSACDSR